MVEIHIRHGQASADSGWGLTEEGKTQALAAAAYLREHYPRSFGVAIYSGSRRAKETAELLGISDAQWEVDKRLSEADFGGNPFPKDFTKWAPVYERVSATCCDVDTQFPDDDRLLVSHGGVMTMVRAYREELVNEEFLKLFEIPRK